MAAQTKNSTKHKPKSYKSMSSEDREKQIIAKAVDLAEKKIEDGTASSQIICHYLDLATEERQRKNEKLKKETELLEAKKDSLETEQKREEIYENALKAFTSYSGGHYDENL